MRYKIPSFLKKIETYHDNFKSQKNILDKYLLYIIKKWVKYLGHVGSRSKF